MQIILPISRKTFAGFKMSAIQNAPHDYYNRVGNRGSSCYHQREARDSNKEQRFIERVIELQNANFPFNIFNQIWGCHERLPLRVGGDATIYTRWGYHIDHENQCYAYSTCAGNFHGVYKCRETGQYYSFMSGSRHALGVPHGEEDVNNTPVLYETSAPAEMKFYERQADFLIRMGEGYSAKYFAEHCPDITMSEDGYSLSDYDVYHHFKQLNPSFDNLIFTEIFKNTSPEKYLLDRYRNNKFKPETLTGKDLIAWNLLTQDVKDRFVKWG